MKIKAAVFDIDGTLVPYGAPGPGQAAAWFDAPVAPIAAR